MCYMLIFVKEKKTSFENFFDIFFELFNFPPLHPNYQG